MKNRSLALLSGEGGSIPKAEVESLFETYDSDSTFLEPEERLVIAESSADAIGIANRVAFARRVGFLIEDPTDAATFLRGKKVRFMSFDLVSGRPPPDPGEYIGNLDVHVDLVHPDYELTLVRGREDHLAVTSPSTMVQGWSLRRPRTRPYFHPAAIFPKLSRALVNLTGCKEGDIFLDPFAGTGSIPIEAFLVGAKVVAEDRAERMVRGEVANMKHFQQEWLGVVRADSTGPLCTRVDSVATDVPYGRASSTGGHRTREILDRLLPRMAEIIRPGRKMVVMHQKEAELASDEKFEILQEHDIRVHKLLTRTISVLRRR